MLTFHYSIGNKHPLPIACRVQEKPRRLFTLRDKPAEIEKRRTGDRRINELEFYAQPPVPIRYVPRPL